MRSPRLGHRRTMAVLLAAVATAQAHVQAVEAAAERQVVLELPSDPWQAVLAAARLQAPDPVLVALLVVDHRHETEDARQLLEQRYEEVVQHRRAGQLDLIRTAHAVVRCDPASAVAVQLLRMLLNNHLGWSPTGLDRDMRRLMRQLERMTPAQRAEVMRSAAEVEGRA